MLGLLREKLLMTDGEQKRLSAVSIKKVHRLNDLIGTLKQDCVRLYEAGKYFRQDPDYMKILYKAMENGREINRMKWKKEPELLKIFKAKANCFMGRVWEQRSAYDRALGYMIPARRWIEQDMLQYVIPEFYVEINRCMAKCYMEKNCDTALINDCLECADKVLQDAQVKEDIINNYDKYYYNALMLELNLQWAIVNLDSYGQKRRLEIEPTWKYLNQSEIYYKELKNIENCEIKGFAWKEWYQIQDETLATTKGVYFKNLYFLAVKVHKKLKKLNKNKGKENGEGYKKVRNWYDMVKSLAEIVSEELDRLEKELVLPHITDNQIDQCKYQRLSDMKKELQKSEAKDRTLDWDAPDVVYLKRIASALRDICFTLAFITYAAVINRKPCNTICLGGMAGLLYDKSKPDKNFPEWEELMKEWCPNVKERSLPGLLDQILKTENCNMYALNIKAALQYNPDKLEEIDIYAALRQSSLKRKFRRIEGHLWALFPDDEKARNVYMLKITLPIISLYREVVGFMNSAIVNCKSKRWKDLQIGHYTKLDVLTKLINREGDSMYRLHNAHHMNDNREGVLLIDHLRERINSSDSSLIDDIMNKYAYDQNGAVRSYVYIGSFTSSVDDLDMWKSYGDKGKGVCIQFDATRFFDREAKYSLADISTTDGQGSFKMEDTKYPLYMVVYLPDKEYGSESVDGKAKILLKDTLTEARIYAERRAEAEKENPLEKNWWKKQAHLIKRLGEVEEKILERLCEIQDTYDELKKAVVDKEEKLEAFEKELSAIIMVIIDLIRFLIKRDHFRNEREYRVIQYSSDPQYEDVDAGIPRLFIPMEKTPPYKKIYFGSAVTDFDSKAAYILNIRKNRKNVEERKTWEIEVCKSSVSIREV